jgi:hypothetical protein
MEMDDVRLLYGALRCEDESGWWKEKNRACHGWTEAKKSKANIEQGFHKG